MLRRETKSSLNRSLQGKLKEQAAVQHLIESLLAFSQLVMQILKQKFSD